MNLFKIIGLLVVVVCVASVFFQTQIVARFPVLTTPLSHIRATVLWCVEPLELAYNWIMKPINAVIAKVKALLGK